MDSLSNLVVCGLLQVTLVAAVGLICVVISGRWSRVSAATLSFTTLTAIVMLTLLAFVPWPSWLDANAASDAGIVAEAKFPSAARESSDFAFDASKIRPEEIGLREFVSAGVEGLRNMNRKSAVLPSTTTDSSPESPPQASAPWSRWFVGMFMAGVVLGLIRLIGGIIGVRLMVRSSRPLRDGHLREMVDVLTAELHCLQHIEIRECTRLATAATVGWRHPVILISDFWKTWSEGQLRSVLAHEIAHVARGDFSSTVAAQLGLVLHFYHPLVHWLVNRLRLEQELAADGLAASVVGGSQVYLRAIGELALMQSQEHVSWPAHTFLPTRRTFLRRIEMLRDTKLLADRAPFALRAGSIIVVLAVTLVVAGIRPPGGNSDGSAVAAQPLASSNAAEPAATARQSKELEAQYVPVDATAVAVIRPADLVPFYEHAMKSVKLPGSSAEDPVALETEKPFLDLMKKCQQVTVIMGPIHPREPEPLAVMLKFNNKATRDAAVKQLSPKVEYQKEKLLLAEIEVSGFRARYLADDATLILGHTETVKRMILAGPSSLSPLTQTDEWKAASKQTVALAVATGSIREVMSQVPQNPITGILSPLWMQADSHTLSILLREKTDLKLTSISPDEKAAKTMEATLNAGMAMVNEMVVNLESNVPPSPKENIQLLVEFLNSRSLERKGNTNTLTLSGNADAQTRLIVGLLAKAVVQARAPGQRAVQKNNLREIMRAMQIYHDKYGHFPPSVVIDPLSGVGRSWRVELLPFLENAPLYEQYQKDQPWDSEANKAVLDNMPAMFRHPSQPTRSTLTSVFEAYGPGLLFEPSDKDGTTFREILDGTSNTIAVLEARRDIPWTKPEDILIDTSQDKLPELGGFSEGGGHVGLADGSVRFISNQLDIKTLKNLFTRAGGEVVGIF